MIRKIRFNGTGYQSPADMPPAVRAAYENALHLARVGGPPGRPGSHVSVNVSTHVRFVHDGKVYASKAEKRPEVREKYEKAMGEIDKDLDGVLDVFESGDAPSLESSIMPLVPQPPVISGDQSGKSLPIAALLIILFLLAVIAGLAVFVLSH